MSYDCHGVLLIFALLLTPAAGCASISQQNSTYGRVTNLNIHRDELPSSLNSSCSWVINNAAGDSYSYYMISLRQIEVERQWSSSTHELVFISEQQQIVLKDINQRSLYLPSAGKLRIELRHKSQPNSLNVRHFAIEYLFVNPSTVTADRFRCSKSGVIIPAAWKCNCLNECLLDDASDEESCPLCALAKPFDSLLCHAGEDWCLPTNRSTTEMDPKGVCVPNAPSSQCTYSAKCEIIFVYRQNYGDIALSNALLAGRQSLCLIIVAEPKHKIKLALTQYSFADQRPDLEYSVYDGSEEQSRLLTSSNWLSTKQVVQTYQHHVATISIRKRALADDVIPSDTQSAYRNSILLNITWFTSLCPEDEMVCGGHFEAKCYTKQQRCDGIWDCISGDDELGCAPSSCPTTFSCNDQLRLPSDRPRCYTWYERCNGNAFCANRTDEKNCTSWWCNSDNGTFLCRNRNCIYEIWACDGTDDCGDNSDEINCPSRVPRRIVTAAVIGATVCSTLFIIALACTCKLFHMRSAERRASYRLLNPQRYIEQRREELQRRSSRHSSSNDESTVVPEDTRRVAPPSYNQTMGFCDDTEERQAFLAEHLRLAGLSNLIPSLNLESSSRTSRHRSRRHRRYRRHQRSRRAESEHSRVALLDPFVTHSAPPAPPLPPSTAPSAGRFDRWRSQFRSLFAGNLSVNSNDIAASDLDAREQRTSSPPIVLTTRPCVQSCELPPPYADDHLLSSRHDSNGQPLTSAPSTAPTFRLIRIRKHQVPLDTFQNQSEQQAPQQTSSSPPTATIDDDEQASSDDDKLLVP